MECARETRASGGGNGRRTDGRIRILARAEISTKKAVEWRERER